MKPFFAALLGTLAGWIVAALGFMFLAAVGLGVLASFERPMAPVASGSYLVFDLDVNITDSPPAFDSGGLRVLFGNEEAETLQLREVTRALRAAATDERIGGLFIKGSMAPAGYGSGYAALKEVREAIRAFKASGKPAIAYLDTASTRDFYLASAAGEVVLDPYGTVIMPGLASEPMFYAGAFERFGVGVQVTRVGKYKSAVEPFTRRDLSVESREQLELLLNDVWSELLTEIGAGRGLAPDIVQAVVDEEGLVQAEQAVESGLVTRAAYYDELVDRLKKETDQEGEATFKQIALADYAQTLAAKPGVGASGGKIAVIYAEGAIVDGEGRPGEVGAAAFTREIRRLREDADIGAIVLRVNSPGGSALASEHIQRELRRVGATKPVIVSMGSYAASGGYWISTYADRIYAEPATITGSIGVFGLQFNVQKLANDLGLTFDSVKTGRFADMFTIARPKTEAEIAMLQRKVDWIYDEFVNKVAEGRKLDSAKVREIAQGRVWSGREAIALGLVDEEGGLDTAIAHAAEVAGLKPGFAVTEYPKAKPLWEALEEILDQKRQQAASRGMLGQILGRLKVEASVLEEFNDPQCIYARLPIPLAIR